MKVLHILNDGPSKDAKLIIEQQVKDHDIQVVDLDEGEISYSALIDLIENCDRVFSW